MPVYLSDEWMEAARVALAESEPLRSASADAEVVLQYEVTGAPGGKCSYALRFDHGSVTLETGAHPDASTSFALDYDVAARIARGELSAQGAFMQGHLKLGGDVNVLIRQHALLEGLDDALHELRGSTEY